MNDDIKQFGERVRALRHERGLSQDMLGEKAGINAKYVGEVERGRRNPSLSILLQLARGLDVEPAELVGDDLAALGRDALVTDIIARLATLTDAELRSTARILRRFGRTA